MNEKDWEECLSENSAIKSSKDDKKAISLMNTADGRINFLNNHKIAEENANYIFEGFYTSVLEILHSIVTKEGYKISNHICLGYYLRDKIKREELFRIFDDLRYKRNSIVYYGKEMDLETARDAIVKVEILIRELKEIYK